MNKYNRLKYRREFLRFLLRKKDRSATIDEMVEQFKKVPKATVEGMFLTLAALDADGEVVSVLDKNGEATGAKMTSKGVVALETGKYHYVKFDAHKFTAYISTICAVVATTIGVVQYQQNQNLEEEIQNLKIEVELLKSE